MKRGFILGKFLPPHAGHVSLIRSAAALVDELTILVCGLPGDEIAGRTRLEWMRELFPQCRVVLHDDPAAPQAPEDHPRFWQIWTDIVRQHHPEPIDRVFAGEAYGAELARHLAAFFVPLGGRILGADRHGLGGLSSTAVRGDWWGHWHWLPKPSRAHYSLSVVLHGVESTGKSTLAARLADHYDTVLVPEYGRAHCEIHGTDCREEDLTLIGLAQQAEIEAARPWCNRLLIADTDALMTAAWSQMMIGFVPDQLMCHRKADLYLMLAADVPFVDDGTRVYGEPRARQRFDSIARDVLQLTRAPTVVIEGDFEARFEAARAAIDLLIAERRAGGIVADKEPIRLRRA
ncbi:nicotinamide-nucleotide adenylyltransferase [Sphingomonas rosea]|uniref:Nicotinamide-nucleotide adenylyltransferase n=1 Tax=Sphingomonas rosea TaxID=335605 RepID=A0ABP7UED1_9SPHN